MCPVQSPRHDLRHHGYDISGNGLRSTSTALVKGWSFEPFGQNRRFNHSIFIRPYGCWPKSSILMGFSIIFTIHLGIPLFLETPIYDHWISFNLIIYILFKLASGSLTEKIYNRCNSKDFCKLSKTGTFLNQIFNIWFIYVHLDSLGGKCIDIYTSPIERFSRGGVNPFIFEPKHHMLRSSEIQSRGIQGMTDARSEISRS